MKLAQSLLVLLLAVRAVPAADGSLTDFFPAGTKVVLGLNVRQIANSTLGQSIVAQAKAQVQSKVQAQPGAADWLKLASMAGFDPLRDIDEVLVSTTGEGQNPPSLIVVSGRFDVAKLAAGANRYLGIPILGGTNPTDGVVAFVTSSTALAGDRPTVLATLDHLGNGSQIDAALAQRVAAARSHYDIWGLGERPDGFVAPTPQASGLESIDRFQFGMSMSSGLELAAEVHARSEKDAQQIGALLAMVQAMVKSQPSTSAAKFEVKTEKGTFKVSVMVPETEVLKAMRSQTGGMTQAVAEKPMVRPSPMVTMSPVAVTPAPSPVKQPVKGTPASVIYDKEGNTIILTLPGAKK